MKREYTVEQLQFAYIVDKMRDLKGKRSKRNLEFEPMVLTRDGDIRAKGQQPIYDIMIQL